MWGILLLAFVAAADDRIYQVNVRPNEIKVMSYNVQNLFDAEHDEGKKDFEFLPRTNPWKKYCDPKANPFDFQSFSTFATMGKREQYCFDTDWTEARVDQKIDHIKEALDLQGEYPDILVLSEVENPKVVGRLAKATGYHGFYMTESPDKRGIDLAVMFKEDKLSPIDFTEKEVSDALYPTRNASVAHFQLSDSLGGGILGIYPVHWPSQAGPTIGRLSAARTVQSLIEDSERKYAGQEYHVVVTGDFNSLKTEDPHPIRSTLGDRAWEHRLHFTRDLVDKANHPHIDRMPRATYFYGAKKQWNYFDRILVSKSLNDNRGLEVDPISYRIHAPRRLSRENDAGERIPFRYNHRAENPQWLGYSDHFAVHVKLRFQRD